MKYIALITWVIGIWLGSAWTEGAIGVWGMNVALLNGIFWLLVILVANSKNKEKEDNSDD